MLVLYPVNKVNSQYQNKFYEYNLCLTLYQVIYFFLLVSNFTDKNSIAAKPMYSSLNLSQVIKYMAFLL